MYYGDALHVMVLIYYWEQVKCPLMNAIVDSCANIPNCYLSLLLRRSLMR